MFVKEATTFLFLLASVFICVSEATVHEDVLFRGKRQLLFPNSTLLQFNAGIGTPSPANMINVNWAFQANFQLPWNRTQIPFDIFEANSGYGGLSRKKRDRNAEAGEMKRDGDYESDAKLYHFYKYVGEVLDSFGQNGTSCVLQTLCRLGTEPLHSVDEEDLLHEIASYVLNPTNDVSLGISEKDEHYRYIEAYKHGENGSNCFDLYNDCATSFVDMFTRLHGNY